MKLPRLLRRNAGKESPDLMEAKRQFHDQGLPFPYIPPEMQAGFRRLDEWVFGIGHHGRGLYDFDQFTWDAITLPAQDFLLLGLGGRGLSQAIHYYLARNPLFLYLQIAYGGAYTDNADAVKSMTRRYAQSESLIRKLSGSIRADVLGQDERWIIGDSDFYGISWIKTCGYELADAEIRKLEEHEDVLQLVLDKLVDPKK